MKRYKTTCETKVESCLERTKIYGIDGFDDYGNLCLHIGSITYDSVVAERIADILNRNDVSLINAEDVIRDYIYGIFCR